MLDQCDDDNNYKKEKVFTMRIRLSCPFYGSWRLVLNNKYWRRFKSRCSWIQTATLYNWLDYSILMVYLYFLKRPLVQKLVRKIRHRLYIRSRQITAEVTSLKRTGSDVTKQGRRHEFEGGWGGQCIWRWGGGQYSKNIKIWKRWGARHVTWL